MELTRYQKVLTTITTIPNLESLNQAILYKDDLFRFTKLLENQTFVVCREGVTADNTTVISHLIMAQSLQSQHEIAIVRRVATTLCRLRKTFGDTAYTEFGGMYIDMAVFECQRLDRRVQRLQARAQAASVAMPDTEPGATTDVVLADSEGQDWIIVRRPSAS